MICQVKVVPDSSARPRTYFNLIGYTKYGLVHREIVNIFINKINFKRNTARITMQYSFFSLRRRQNFQSHMIFFPPIYTNTFSGCRFSMNLYAQIERETGQEVGFHRCGSLRLAATANRLDEFR